MNKDDGKEKFINLSDLQAQISAVTKDVQTGNRYTVMRYSQPLCVMLSYKEYLDLIKQVKSSRGKVCEKCDLWYEKSLPWLCGDVPSKTRSFRGDGALFKW